jgi:hypothetical protein
MLLSGSPYQTTGGKARSLSALGLRQFIFIYTISLKSEMTASIDMHVYQG